MGLSVIIPTYNRPNDLKRCIESVENQTLLPEEILIIDNGEGSLVEEFIQEEKARFAAHGCLLYHVKNNVNSLTVARNIGSRLATGEIVIYLDDDVILDKNYIYEIHRVYMNNPRALGVQGYILPEKVNPARNLIYRIFYWYHLDSDLCRVMPSISTTYPFKLDKVTGCQWLSGANHSYRREIFEEFQYDEKLYKYSDGEDLEFSYRVFKKNPGSLFITPFAQLVHNVSPSGRLLGKELIYMQEIYGLYLFYKLFKPSLKDKGIFLWSRIGRLLLTLIRVAVKRHQGAASEVFQLFGAYYTCLSNLGKLKHGDLEFFNKKLV